MTIIPAPALQLLRGALHRHLGDVAEDMASASTQPQADRLRVAEWSEPVAIFDRTRVLLDGIDRSDSEPEHDAEIEPHAYPRVFERVLSDEMATEHHLRSEQGATAAGQREHAYRRALTIETFMHEAGLEEVK